jgi:hypothetical protein
VRPRPALQPCRPLAFLLTGLLSAGLASAQAGPFRPAVAVLRLRNLSAYGGDLLGRRAADQLALDLGSTGVWRVQDRTQTDRACLQRDLRPPYAVGYMQEIGHALAADLVSSGALQAVEVDPRAGVVRVTIYVEAVDQVSGQLVVGTQQSAETRRDTDHPLPTDVLVGRAVAVACAKAAKVTALGPALQGEVTDPRDSKSVLLKLPEQAALRPGQRLLLYRAVTEGEAHVPGRLIAALMVTEAKAGSAEARVLAHSGDIHTGDIAVTVSDAPQRPPAADGGKSR